MRRSDVIDDPQAVWRVSRCLFESHPQRLTTLCPPQSLGPHDGSDSVISRRGEANFAGLAADPTPDLGDRTPSVIQRPDLLDQE